MIINKENIDAILFDYAEGNLTASEKQQVEAYLLVHKEDKQKLDLYDSNITIDKPTMVFDDKQSLYDIAKTKRPSIIVISKYIKWVTATAAALTLIIGIKAFYSTKQPVQIAKTSPKIETSSPTNSVVSHTAQIITHTNSAVLNTNLPVSHTNSVITHTNSATTPTLEVIDADTSLTAPQTTSFFDDIAQNNVDTDTNTYIDEPTTTIIEPITEDLIAQNTHTIEESTDSFVIIETTETQEPSQKERPDILKFIREKTNLDELANKAKQSFENIAKLKNNPISKRILANFGDREEETIIIAKSN